MVVGLAEVFFFFFKSDLGGVVCYDRFVWVVDGFIILDMWWIVYGVMANQGICGCDLRAVTGQPWVCDLDQCVGIWVGVVGWTNFQ